MQLYRNIKNTEPNAISAPFNGKFFPKNVINKAAINGKTTITQANSAKMPPSV